RWVRPGGMVDTLAGPRFFVGQPNGDGGPARRAFIDSLGQGNYLAGGPDGGVYLAEAEHGVRRIAPLAENFVAGELVVPARDGSEVFAFTPGGRHLRTVDGLTGALRYQFTYDAAGQLASITDGSGNVTTVERDGNGAATAILGPFGQRT